MGSQHDWLYSQALFGTGELLKKRVLEEVQRARDKEKSST